MDAKTTKIPNGTEIEFNHRGEVRTGTVERPMCWNCGTNLPTSYSVIVDGRGWVVASANIR